MAVQTHTAKGLVIFEEPDQAQKVIDSCAARNVSMYIDNSVMLIHLVKISSVAGLLEGRVPGELRERLKCPDVAYFAEIPARSHLMEIFELVTPYGTILRIKKIKRKSDAAFEKPLKAFHRVGCPWSTGSSLRLLCAGFQHQWIYHRLRWACPFSWCRNEGHHDELSGSIENIATKLAILLLLSSPRRQA